jgi:hypothetical protein
MGWTKREVEGDLVILGDAEGHVKQAGGLLVAIKPDPMYPNNRRYTLVRENGEEFVVPGSASINRQLSPNDVGHFIKLEFVGWGKSANGKFKEIAVHVWDGAPNERMAKWPRYDEFKNGGKNGSPPPAVRDEFEDFPNALDNQDDDLPF